MKPIRRLWAAIGRFGRRNIVVLAVKRFDGQHMGDAAASLTYYALLSLLPLLVIATSLFALFGDPDTVAKFVNYIAEHGADESTAATVDDVMRSVVHASSGAAIGVLAVSALVSLNSASSAFAAAGRALNVVNDVQEARGFVRRRLTNIGMALAVALLLAIVVATILLGEDLAHDVLAYVGLEGFASDLWLVARLPVAIACATLAYALIYAYAPDREPTRPRVTLGTLVAVAVWILVSLGFAFYLRNFSTFGAAYGAFGAVIVLLLWTWLACCSMLIGAQIDHLRAHPQSESEAAQQPVRRV